MIQHCCNFSARTFNFVNLSSISPTSYTYIPISGLNIGATGIAGVGTDDTSVEIFQTLSEGSTHLTAEDGPRLGARRRYSYGYFLAWGDNVSSGESAEDHSLELANTLGSSAYGGGDSTFDGIANEVIGDVQNLNGSAVVIGGNYRTILSGREGLINFSNLTSLYGDAVSIFSTGSLVGGDDFLDARAVTDTNLDI